jgi:hypothetical protein
MDDKDSEKKSNRYSQAGRHPLGLVSLFLLVLDLRQNNSLHLGSGRQATKLGRHHGGALYLYIRASL